MPYHLVVGDAVVGTGSLDQVERGQHTIPKKGIDISFNLISHGDGHGTPMADMDLENYARPVVTAVRTTFLTWRPPAT